MDIVDRELKCADCGATFVFTAGEQVFFHERKLGSDPKRCKQCRAKRDLNARKPVRPVRPETRTTCAVCGSETTVPFVPRKGKPVLCRQCFQKKQPQAEPAMLQQVNAGGNRPAGVVVPFPRLRCSV